jgi:nitric oxide reductase subunit B
VSGLFLLQGLLGGVNAHYHVEPGGFYGADVSGVLPYNLSRMWHLQLALFFVSASFLAMGIFLAPMIARREPKGQSVLALLLFGALVVVVVGSLLGEAASIHNYIKLSGPWFWLGTQGWEYLDLGRLWQLLLIIGMLLWLVILVRALRGMLAQEHPGNLPWLFLYSAISIPLFYAAGVVFWKHDSYAVVDFWRFWVVHLWVEDFLELFTTIMVAYMFVQLGVIRMTVALTIVYLDIILYSIGGVIGTMHHLYFSGAPATHMALGAFFSAMEVIPLLLLTYEAWRFMKLGAPPGERSLLGADSAHFPHKWAVMFLIAVGFWNFLGAGVFGFLINLPIVSYYEIGTAFTANHGHGAMMGVYGMLAIGFFMFVARYFIPRDNASERAMCISFWSLNIGLLWMLFVNLFPLGLLQLNDSVTYGYWHARQIEFFMQPLVRVVEWLRMPGDVLFIVGGIFPIVYLAVRMFCLRNRYAGLAPEEVTDDFTEPAKGAVTS